MKRLMKKATIIMAGCLLISTLSHAEEEQGLPLEVSYNDPQDIRDTEGENIRNSEGKNISAEKKERIDARLEVHKKRLQVRLEVYGIDFEDEDDAQEKED